MSKLSSEELSDFYDVLERVWEEGVHIHLEKRDARRLFYAIIAANAFTYMSIIGIKKAIKEYRRMVEEDKKPTLVKEEANG